MRKLATIEDALLVGAKGSCPFCSGARGECFCGLDKKALLLSDEQMGKIHASQDGLWLDPNTRQIVEQENDDKTDRRRQNRMKTEESYKRTFDDLSILTQSPISDVPAADMLQSRRGFVKLQLSDVAEQLQKRGLTELAHTINTIRGQIC